MEQRYRAVLEVLDGSPVSEVAVRYGVSRQAVYVWKAKHAAGGIDALREASRRPRSSPTRVPAEVEALVCEMRRAHPRWGARRIAFELVQARVAAPPSRRHPTLHQRSAPHDVSSPSTSAFLLPDAAADLEAQCC